MDSKEKDSGRISFLSNDNQCLLNTDSQSWKRPSFTQPRLLSLISYQNEGSIREQSDDLGGHETKLLDMVRARSRESRDLVADQPLDLPRDEESDDVHDNCAHGWANRVTERSVSRSRISRVSTRRDIDIPSLIAYDASAPTPTHLEIPVFQKVQAPQEEPPRWSIRRSICPVCSQKWRDRTTINNVKSSGLKKNLYSELPSVIAPARLRTSISMRYTPRPALAAIDEDAGAIKSGLRGNRASWQYNRARKLRVPKPLLPPPEATAPPSATAAVARKDLDTRVNRFLTELINDNAKHPFMI